MGPAEFIFETEGSNYTEIEKTAQAVTPKFLIRYIVRLWK